MDQQIYRQIGRQIRRARESLGMSQEELARSLGYSSPATISYYEGGGRKISIVDLRRIGDIVGLPLNYFLEEHASPAASFVKLRAQKVRPSARASLADFVAFARKNGSRPLHPMKGEFNPNPDRAAKQVLKLADTSRPPVRLRAVAAALDVPVYDWQFPDEISGVFFSEDGVVAVGVNEQHPYVRQRFTTAHELGHFVFDSERDLFVDFAAADATAMGDNGGANSLSERKANRFAAALLIPRDWIEEDVGTYGPDLTLLAKRYEVSEQALWFRLLNLRLVESDAAREWVG